MIYPKKFNSEKKPSRSLFKNRQHEIMKYLYENIYKDDYFSVQNRSVHTEEMPSKKKIIEKIEKKDKNVAKNIGNLRKSVPEEIMREIKREEENDLRKIYSSVDEIPKEIFESLKESPENNRENTLEMELPPLQNESNTGKDNSEGLFIDNCYKKDKQATNIIKNKNRSSMAFGSAIEEKAILEQGGMASENDINPIWLKDNKLNFWDEENDWMAYYKYKEFVRKQVENKNNMNNKEVNTFLRDELTKQIDEKQRTKELKQKENKDILDNMRIAMEEEKETKRIAFERNKEKMNKEKEMREKEIKDYHIWQKNEKAKLVLADKRVVDEARKMLEEEQNKLAKKKEKQKEMFDKDKPIISEKPSKMGRLENIRNNYGEMQKINKDYLVELEKEGLLRKNLMDHHKADVDKKLESALGPEKTLKNYRNEKLDNLEISVDKDNLRKERLLEKKKQREKEKKDQEILLLKEILQQQKEQKKIKEYNEKMSHNDMRDHFIREKEIYELEEQKKQEILAEKKRNYLNDITKQIEEKEQLKKLKNSKMTEEEIRQHKKEMDQIHYIKSLKANK